MGEQRATPLSVADFQRCQWEQAIADAPNDTYFRYSELFGKKYAAAKEAGDQTTAAVFFLLRDITFFHFSPRSATEPFTAALIMGGRRSAIPSDLTEEDVQILHELTPSVTNPALRARLADVVWVRKRDFRSAQIAIDAYIESARRFAAAPLELRNAQDVSLVYCVQQIERALRLARLVNDGPRAKEATDYIQQLVRQLAPRLVPLSLQLMDLLIEFRVGDPREYALIAKTAANTSEAYPDTVREFRTREAKWLALAGDEAAQKDAIIAAAEEYVHKADLLEAGKPPSYMLVADSLTRAIEAYRRISNYPRDRVEALHKRLLKVQRLSTSQMGRIASGQIDIRPIAMQAMTAIKGKGLYEALLALAQLSAPPNLKELRARVSEHVKDFPLIHYLAAQVVDASGKVVSKKPSMATDDADEIEEAMRWSMFRETALHRALTAQAVIEPARQQILYEHEIKVEDWQTIVENNPVVPPERQQTFARGLQAGMTGDLLIAANLLIPQLENSFRYVLSASGNRTSKLLSEGVQEDITLQPLLESEDFKRVFSEDLAFDLEGLLVARSGPNLRHRLAHGLIDDRELSSSADLTYLWWLVLRMSVLPVFWRLAPVEAESLYDRDYYGWTEGQAEAVERAPLQETDFSNVAEEIKDLGKSEERELENRLKILLSHLLKWKYQPEKQCNSWRASVQEQRVAVRRLLRKSPSLQPKTVEILPDAFEEARYAAEAETGLDDGMFPKDCPWSFDQCVDEQFWPEATVA